MTKGLSRAELLSWAVLWAGAILLSMAFIDRPAAHFAHDHLRQPIFLQASHLSEAVEPISIACLALFGLAGLLGWRPGRAGRPLIAMALAGPVASIAKQQLKYLAGRTWPETWTHGNPSFIHDGVFGFFPLHGGEGWSSFPSGHTTLIAAPMTVLALGFPRLRWLAVSLPLIEIIGLVGMDYHWVSDCIAGIGIGVATGAGITAATGVRA